MDDFAGWDSPAPGEGTEQGSRIGGDDFASFDFPDSTPAASATSDTPVDNTVIMSATATDNNEVPGVAEDERKSDDRANTELANEERIKRELDALTREKKETSQSVETMLGKMQEYTSKMAELREAEVTQREQVESLLAEVGKVTSANEELARELKECKEQEEAKWAKERVLLLAEIETMKKACEGASAPEPTAQVIDLQIAQLREELSASRNETEKLRMEIADLERRQEQEGKDLHRESQLMKESAQKNALEAREQLALSRQLLNEARAAAANDEQKSEMEMKAFKQDMVEKLRQQLMEDRRKMSEAQKEWRNQQMAALQAQVGSTTKDLQAQVAALQEQLKKAQGEGGGAQIEAYKKKLVELSTLLKAKQQNDEVTRKSFLSYMEKGDDQSLVVVMKQLQVSDEDMKRVKSKNRSSKKSGWFG